MPLIQTPTFESPEQKLFRIDEPCSGGINLLDLEFEQEPNQSPNVLNMMYRNGAFGKRFGQKVYHTFENNIYGLAYFRNKLIVHSGTKLYEESDTGFTEIYSGLPQKSGVFFNFNKMLYYLSDKYYVYDEQFGVVDPYVPDLVINRKPDGTYSDVIDDYNRIGTGFKNSFHGDGESTVYVLTDKELDEKTPIVEVDGEEKTIETDFTIDYEKGEVTFTTAPPKGTNNVVITVYKTEQEYIDSIMNCKYSISYGGENNSRLFLAGNGNSMYFFSDVFDATYFPETNYASIGNTEEDIQGFGEQYDVLIIFKPKEIYAIEYYTDSEGIGRFTSKLVNAKMGCDVPYSIQLINNLLVWCSTINGVCTLVSTNIEDERNVRTISRNIDGGYRINGLKQESNLHNAVSVDWDGKYMLTINGKVYMWDYLLTPYSNTGKIDNDAKRLAWYLFDNFNVKQYLKAERDLYYSKGKDLVILDTTIYNDFGESIHAVYQTPLFQFDAIEYLKTVKNMYVQVRADTASVIHIKYITEEIPQGEEDAEPIIIPGKIWDYVTWDNFGWDVINFGSVMRRKCQLKKVQMAGVLFENDEVDRDMSISHLSFQYQLVKTIK